MRLERWWTAVATATLADRTGQEAAWLEPRIGVHRTNYQEARVAALAQAYPAVERVIGADCFGAWARDYVAGKASADPDLNRHGRDFPAWLRRRRTQRLAGLDYLPDLARLERAVNSAYYAADFGHEVKGGLRLTPSLRLVASPYPVDEIWRLNLTGVAAERVAAAGGWRRIVVWRPTREVVMEAVPARLFRALRCLRRDGRLEVLVESGLQPQDAAALVTHGWVTGWQEAIT